MVLADRGLVCIDEFDKMSDQVSVEFRTQHTLPLIFGLQFYIMLQLYHAAAQRPHQDTTGLIAHALCRTV